jgi:hypothetical protein
MLGMALQLELSALLVYRRRADERDDRMDCAARVKRNLTALFLDFNRTPYVNQRVRNFGREVKRRCGGRLRKNSCCGRGATQQHQLENMEHE